ncbi:MAG: rod shape-determining protein MreC, partial [Lactobacillus sp.]|nr:rod shape-determining protein MreC [Lactobacillus sp.]
MKKFLQNKKLLSACIIVVLIFAILGGSVSMRNKRNTPMIIQSFGNDVVAVGARIIDFPLSFVSGSLNNVHDLMNTQNENNYLKSKVTDLEQTKTRNATLEAENKQLKSALKLKESLTDS